MYRDDPPALIARLSRAEARVVCRSDALRAGTDRLEQLRRARRRKLDRGVACGLLLIATPMSALPVGAAAGWLVSPLLGGVVAVSLWWLAWWRVARIADEAEDGWDELSERVRAASRAVQDARAALRSAEVAAEGARAALALRSAQSARRTCRTNGSASSSASEAPTTITTV